MKQPVDKHNRWGDTSFLFGRWSGPCKDGVFSKWNPDLAMVAATVKFAATTGRLDKGAMPDRVEPREGVQYEEEESEEEESEEEEASRIKLFRWETWRQR